MLEKPALPDDQIIACLQANYSLCISQLTFLPLGGNLSTAVYRAVSDDGAAYFCKLRRGPFNPISVALPNYLSAQGIAHIIPPLRTSFGQLCAPLDVFTLIVYPFVEGTSGYDVELSERQWADFGAAFRRLHTTSLPPQLRQLLRTEEYAPEWRERCRRVFTRLDQGGLDESLAVELAAFLGSKREMVLHAVERAEQLAQGMRSRSLAAVACHADIHPGNLLLTTTGALYIVDWDDPVLAPKERDLMFIGGGQGFQPYIAEREEALFYRGYGPPQRDPLAMAYYRYERGITDVTVECERVLSTSLGQEDRTQALAILQLYFLPGCTLEMAYRSDPAYRKQ